MFVQVLDPSTNKRKFLIQERSDTKDYAPGCYMLSSGGVFGPGEGKFENARRELEEETGISVNSHFDATDDNHHDDLIDAGWMNYSDPKNRVWASLFILNTT